jgi:hypothetical protein
LIQVALLILIIAAFVVMSAPFRAVFALSLGGFVYHVLSTQRGFFAQVDEQQLTIFLHLYSAIVGVFLLGTAMGIMRLTSKTREIYTERRKKLLLFLGKWGVIYVLFALTVTWLIDQILHDSFGAFLLVKRYGMMGFLMLVAAIYLIKVLLGLRQRILAKREAKAIQSRDMAL